MSHSLVPYTFPHIPGLELHADRLGAELDIQVQPGPITVTAAGEQADTIRAYRSGNTVKVTGGPAAAAFGGGGVTVVSGSSVHISGVVAGAVYVDGVRINPAVAAAVELPRVTVTAPEGTPVTLTDPHGSARVGDTRGNLALVLTGHAEVTVGAVAALGCRIKGSGKVAVARVDGPVTAEISGSGDVRIDRGFAPTFTASVAGSGDVAFGGTARMAALTVAGSGDIYLARSINPPARHAAGSGDIRVGQIGGGA